MTEPSGVPGQLDLEAVKARQAERIESLEPPERYPLSFRHTARLVHEAEADLAATIAELERVTVRLSDTESAYHNSHALSKYDPDCQICVEEDEPDYEETDE